MQVLPEFSMNGIGIRPLNLANTYRLIENQRAGKVTGFAIEEENFHATLSPFYAFFMLDQLAIIIKKWYEQDQMHLDHDKIGKSTLDRTRSPKATHCITKATICHKRSIRARL